MIKSLLVQDKTFNNVEYKIRFSKRAKYLQLRINHSHELELVIPKRYSLKDGERFINSKLDWIKKHYSPQISKKKTFFFLGDELFIKQSFDFFLEKHKIKLAGNNLIIVSPADNSTSGEEIYNAFLKNWAKKYIINRTGELADKFGFKVKRISIRGQRSRWGSCSSKGTLSFNFQLMKFRKEVIDYVIIHELSHLKEMNHSNRFWKLVDGFCPNYKILRKELKLIKN